MRVRLGLKLRVRVSSYRPRLPELASSSIFSLRSSLVGCSRILRTRSWSWMVTLRNEVRARVRVGIRVGFRF